MTAKEWIRTVILLVSFTTGGVLAYNDVVKAVGDNAKDIAHNKQRVEEECARSLAIDKLQDGRERQMAIDVTGIKKDISYMREKLGELVTELRKE